MAGALELAPALILGYALGMIQTGYIVGRLYGLDIREHGSKNAGMTNVNRTLGKWPALLVFCADVSKAAAAFVFVPVIVAGATWSFGDWAHEFGGGAGPGALPAMAAGLGAVLGHNFPFYLKFRGGKGVSSTLGIILMLDWRAALPAFALGICLVAAFRYISLASLAVTLAWPLLLLALGRGAAEVMLAAAISCLAWAMHRENIGRLLSKTERKFTLGK